MEPFFQLQLHKQLCRRSWSYFVGPFGKTVSYSGENKLKWLCCPSLFFSPLFAGRLLLRSIFFSARRCSRTWPGLRPSMPRSRAHPLSCRATPLPRAPRAHPSHGGWRALTVAPRLARTPRWPRAPSWRQRAPATSALHKGAKRICVLVGAHLDELELDEVTIFSSIFPLFFVSACFKGLHGWSYELYQTGSKFAHILKQLSTN